MPAQAARKPRPRPATRPRIAPTTPQDFADEGDRRRLSATGIKAYLAVAARWKLPGQACAALLGVSTSTWERIKAGSWDGSLSQDQLTRVSAIVGIYKGLHLLFADGMADRWPGLKNRGPLFGGQAPVEAMVGGGIPLMLDVRRHVDALRGGL